ncbi:MAG: carboxypeptidase-like regulatory domain-containing protein [Vicinamibacterales bacterium]
MSVHRLFAAGLVVAALVLTTPTAWAQVQTGSIAGTVSDTSGAVLPGVSVTLSGERLIGGPQTAVTDAAGSYRFDRLVPGTYSVKFELQGFKTVDRADVRINAAFVATISPRLEVGSLTETITVTGESPTVDVRSNVQQTVMSQEILEGVPTGRDPWSLAKIIPGVQVSTYDVGGTQSMQQSSMSSHGSNTADVSYNIDGATVNWPGGGGGATMLYYDQGDVRRGQLHDLGHPGGSAGRRRVDQHGDQDRQQPVARQRAATSRTTACSRRTSRRPARPTRASSATRPRRRTTSTCRAAARWCRTSCGSTAPTASGW